MTQRGSEFFATERLGEKMRSVDSLGAFKSISLAVPRHENDRQILAHLAQTDGRFLARPIGHRQVNQRGIEVAWTRRQKQKPKANQTITIIVLGMQQGMLGKEEATCLLESSFQWFLWNIQKP